ncbi:hypothetical protein Tco_0810182 [Tanacetum coccineum]
MELNRSKSRYSIKECSTCGSWYTKECCSIGNLKDQIIVPVSDSFQHCAVCGTPVDGPYCHGYTPESSKTILKRVMLHRASVVDQDPGAHFGYNCPPKDPIISEPEPFYNQNFDCFPHDSQILPQQYFCCENCGGPHETYQCQPMNQEYFYSHSSGFDQFQPPQFSDAYQIPPVASMEMLHAQADLIESMQNFLMKYDHIPHNEKSIKLLLAEEKFLKIKQVVEEEQFQPEYLQNVNKSSYGFTKFLMKSTTQARTPLTKLQKDQERRVLLERLLRETFKTANHALNESHSSKEMNNPRFGDFRISSV